MPAPALVKICGLRTAEAIDAAIGAGADMVGFVFFAPSPRHVEPAEAAALARHVGGRARTVALTVEAADEALDAIVAALSPDLLQLHGKESPDRVEAIRRRFGRPVIKAIGVETAADLAALGAYRGGADWLMLDAKPPRGAALPGGNGRPFDWSLLAGLDLPPATMLSGGLDPANVAEAIRISRPAAVDVSSGVERRPGEKDPDKIRAFVAAARAAFGEAR